MAAAVGRTPSDPLAATTAGPCLLLVGAVRQSHPVRRAHPGDIVTVEEGNVEAGQFLAPYRQAGQPVSVLGLDQMRLFTWWRRRLSRGD